MHWNQMQGLMSNVKWNSYRNNYTKYYNSSAMRFYDFVIV